MRKSIMSTYGKFHIRKSVTIISRRLLLFAISTLVGGCFCWVSMGLGSESYFVPPGYSPQVAKKMGMNYVVPGVDWLSCETKFSWARDDTTVKFCEEEFENRTLFLTDKKDSKIWVDTTKTLSKMYDKDRFQNKCIEDTSKKAFGITDKTIRPLTRSIGCNGIDYVLHDDGCLKFAWLRNLNLIQLIDKRWITVNGHKFYQLSGYISSQSESSFYTELTGIINDRFVSIGYQTALSSANENNKVFHFFLNGLDFEDMTQPTDGSGETQLSTEEKKLQEKLKKAIQYKKEYYSISKQYKSELLRLGKLQKHYVLTPNDRLRSQQLYEEVQRSVPLFRRSVLSLRHAIGGSDTISGRTKIEMYSHLANLVRSLPYTDNSALAYDYQQKSLELKEKLENKKRRYFMHIDLEHLGQWDGDGRFTRGPRAEGGLSVSTPKFTLHMDPVLLKVVYRFYQQTDELELIQRDQNKYTFVHKDLRENRRGDQIGTATDRIVVTLNSDGRGSYVVYAKGGDKVISQGPLLRKKEFNWYFKASPPQKMVSLQPNKQLRMPTPDEIHRLLVEKVTSEPSLEKSAQYEKNLQVERKTSTATTKLASRQPVKSTPSSAPAITLSQPTVKYGQTITIRFSNGPGVDKSWIGLYKATAPDKRYLSYQYINLKNNGQLTFAAPNEAGQFNFRMFKGIHYMRVASSPVLQVLPLDIKDFSDKKVSFSKNDVKLYLSSSNPKPGTNYIVYFFTAPGNKKDWIGMYRSSDPDKKYLTYKYLNGKSQGYVTFKLPETEGEYNFRLFVNDGYDLFATSENVVVAR